MPIDRASSRRPFTTVLACALASILAFPASVFAHADSVGTPIKPSGQISKGVVFDTAYAYTSFDDGLDFDAEFLLTTTWIHQGHGFEIDQKRVSADTDSSPELDVFEYYTHPECTPREKVTVIATLIEVDSEEADKRLMQALNLGMKVAFMATGVGGPVAFGVGVALKAASMLVSTNKADDFGTVEKEVPSDGTVDLRFMGKSGGAVLPLRGKDYPTQEVTCATTVATADYALSPAGRAETFAEAREGFVLISDIRSETGTATAADAQELADLRATYESIYLSTTRSLAGLEIDRASGLSGTEEALAYFAEAGAAAEQGDGVAAIELYGSAFVAAAQAIEAGEEGSAEALPLELVPFTAVHATRQGRSFDLPLFLVGQGGTGSIDSLELHGLPKTATWTAELSEAPRVASIRIELGDTPAGDYELMITAAATAEVESAELATPFRLAVAAAGIE